MVLLREIGLRRGGTRQGGAKLELVAAPECAGKRPSSKNYPKSGYLAANQAWPGKIGKIGFVLAKMRQLVAAQKIGFVLTKKIDSPGPLQFLGCPSPLGSGQAFIAVQRRQPLQVVEIARRQIDLRH